MQHRPFLQLGALAFSPDGKTIANSRAVSCGGSGGCSSGGVIELWNAATGATVRRIKDPLMVNELLFSADGQLLAGMGGDNGVKIWETHSGKLVRSYNANAAQLLEFAPDGQLLAIADYKSLELRDVKTNVLRRHWQESSPIRALKFSPDGRQLLVVTSDNIRLWRIK